MNSCQFKWQQSPQYEAHITHSPTSFSNLLFECLIGLDTKTNLKGFKHRNVMVRLETRNYL